MSVSNRKHREIHLTIFGTLGFVSAVLVLSLAVAGCRKTVAPSSQGPVRSDQQVSADIQAKYATESALNGQNLQVVVQSGVVTLNGTVTDSASRALAGNDAGTVAGVKTVVNDLTIVPVMAIAPSPQLPRQEARVTARPPDNVHKAKHQSQTLPLTQMAEPGQEAQQEMQAQTPAHTQVADDVAVPAAAPPPLSAAAPEPPPRPSPITVTVVPGTLIPVRITESLDSGQTQVNEVFHGTLAEDLIAGGMIAVPRGSNVIGRVVDARDAGHFSGSSLLSIQLTEIVTRGQSIAVATDTYSKQGQARGSNTAKKAGGGAALGAIIGAIAGGGKGAAIGAAAGGGIGAGANGVTRGQQVQIMPETLVNFRLQIPVAVVTSRKLGSPQTDERDVPRPTLEQRQ